MATAVAVSMAAGFSAVVNAYPEMAGSCGRPGGIHLPNAAQAGSGGFSVELSSPAAGGATVTLTHESKDAIEGFLLRAVDADTLAELGTFDAASLPPNTGLYEGCNRTEAAVCQMPGGAGGRRRRRRLQRRRLHHDHDDDVALPLIVQLSWPKEREMRVMFWAVDNKHTYYLAQASTSAAAVAPLELDPRLLSCTHEPLQPAAMAISLAGFAAVVALGAVVRHSTSLRKTVPHRPVVTLLGHDYGLGGGSLAEVGAGALFLGCQGAAAAQAWVGITGYPAQATSSRVAGLLAASGFSMVMLPVSRFSLWPRLFGISYERALVWHRALGLWTLALIGWHGGNMINDYGLPELFSLGDTGANNCLGTSYIWGTLCLGLGGLLLLLSLGPVRRRCYRFFHITHVILSPLLLIAACLHIQKLVYYLLPSICAELGFNVWGRIRSSRAAAAPRLISVRAHDASGGTGAAAAAAVSRDTFATATGGVVELTFWAPAVVDTVAARGARGFGSWVWLSRAGRTGGGVSDLIDPHPFSIAGLGSGGELKVLVKAMGSGGGSGLLDPAYTKQRCWSRDLLTDVRSGSVSAGQADGSSNGGGGGGGNSDSSLSATLSPQLSVNATEGGAGHHKPGGGGGLEFRLDGPHGRPSLELERASTLVLIGGGIGVTPLLPILEALNGAGDSPLKGALPATRRLIFVWSVRDKNDFGWARQLLADLPPMAAGSASGIEQHPQVEVRLYLTRGGGGGGASDFEGHSIAHGRPDLPSLIGAAKNSDGLDSNAQGGRGGGGVMVFVCGPKPLVAGVHGAAAAASVPVHHETFEM